MIFRKVDDKIKYSFLDARCIGRECWQPGLLQHRSGGSRNLKACCIRRAHHGCPAGPDLQADVTLQGIPIFDARLAAERRKRGWRSE
jgi:hypothetical protein